MPRISPATAPDAQAAALLSGIQKKLGSTPNMFTTMAHSPAVLGLYVNGSASLSVSKLSARLREQIALTAAGANTCDYCASAHTVFGKMHKIDDAELAANLEGRSADPKTQAALAFVKQVINARGHVSDAEIAAVRAAGYGDAEIGEIVAVTVLNIFTNYFNSVMGTDIDFPRVETGESRAAA